MKRAIASLEGMDGDAMIKHVDLWNRNVEFADQDEAWERPAVFVEFGAIEWGHARPAPGKRCSMRCTAELSLHVVTDWHAGEPCCGYIFPDGLPVGLSLCSALEYALTGLGGMQFGNMVPVRELSNHDHGELLEEILVFQYKGWREY